MPFILLKLDFIFKIICILIIIDIIIIMMFGIISLICYKPTKKEKIINTYKYSKEENQEQQTEVKKDRKHKLSRDILYNEAVKFYGKSYVKNRNRIEVVEDYLEEV